MSIKNHRQQHIPSDSSVLQTKRIETMGRAVGDSMEDVRGQLGPAQKDTQEKRRQRPEANLEPRPLFGPELQFRGFLER